jgi:quercetin dioxygenase-like cupin family protein
MRRPKEAQWMDTNVLHEGQGRSVWVVGDLYTFLATGDDTGGAYALIHSQVPPGGGPPPHIHRREDEAFFLLEGQLTLQVDGKSLSATTGAWVTLPKGTLHAFKNPGPTLTKMLILVNPSGLERYFAEVGHATKEESETPEAIESLVTVAPKYGLEVRPPTR